MLTHSQRIIARMALTALAVGAVGGVLHLTAARGPSPLASRSTGLLLGSGSSTDTRVLVTGGAVSTCIEVATGPGDGNDFSITGKISGLFPGGSADLVLAVSNPHCFDLVVTGLTVAPRDATTGCPAANITSPGFAGSLVVPARGTAAQAVTVTMVHSAPAACQGVTFPLDYAGTAHSRD